MVFSKVFTELTLRGIALLLAGFLIGVVVAAPFFPYAGVWSPYDSAHDHSVAYADNGRDYSRLTAYAGQRTDSVLVVCNFSNNGEPGVGRSFDHGTQTGRVTAPYGQCNDLFTGRNNSAHDACNGLRADGSAFGCGPNSRHGS